MSDFLHELADGLRDKVASAKAREVSSLQQFLEQDIVHEKGPWSIDGHEAWGEIISLLDRVIVRQESDTEISVLKAEQIAATTNFLGAALHFVADRGLDVGYFLPTNKFAQAFGRTRIKRMIGRSKYLRELMRDRDAVNQSTIKEFDGRHLYVLGLESMLGAISIPLDMLINDEVDKLPAENREWAQGRIAHSPYRVTLNFSAGYAPGAGIDLLYQEGTQHKFFIRCTTKGCKREVNLEETFPDCMAKIKGAWTRVCPTCFTALDLKKNGRWIATWPERAKQRKYSYRISALAIDAMPAEYIMKRWEKAKRKRSELAKFRCSVLAMPDAGAMQPVTDAELRRMESKEVSLKIAGGSTPRYAGMDTGDLCHFWCEQVRDGRPQLVWLEEIDSDAALDRVTLLIGALGIQQLVIDKKPLTNLARALAYRFPQIVALQDFRDASEMEVVDEEHLPEHFQNARKFRCVKVNRDESLDDFTSEITDPAAGLLIPEIESDAIMATFSTHLKNLRKERTIDAKGRAIDKYVKAVPNHFGMAGNSARIARLIAPPMIPFEYESITPLTSRSRGMKGFYA